MIELKEVSVVFGQGTPLEHRVFNQLNLKIHNKQFVTVIGGNGAGKSTLMNVISGDVGIQQGNILLENKDITAWKPYQRASFISRVFQDPLLGSFSDLTIEENLSLAYLRGKARGLRPALNARIRERCRGALATMGIGLENRMKDKMGLLSGGQRQAVSLVMATLQPAQILLLDEHTAALDPKMEQLVLDLTNRLIVEHQLTVLMITHCMKQALDFGTRTLVMHQGRIVKDLAGAERSSLTPNELIPYF